MKVKNINNPSPKKENQEEKQDPILLKNPDVISLYPIKTPDSNVPEEEQTYQLIHVDTDSSDDFYDFSDVTEDESEKDPGREKTAAFPWHNYSDFSSDDPTTSEDEEEVKNKSKKDKSNTRTAENVPESHSENPKENESENESDNESENSLQDSMFQSCMSNYFLEFFKEPLGVIMECSMDFME